MENDKKEIKHVNQWQVLFLEQKKHMFFEAGHFYSSIVNVDEIKLREDQIWKQNSPSSLPAIELNVSKQLKLLRKFSRFYPEIPFPEEQGSTFRYYFKNNFFNYSDGVILYSFIRHFNPKQIIEIGSGFSSALMLDTIRLLNRPRVKLTFIEPNTERLRSLVSENAEKQLTIFEKKLQEIDLSFFKRLKRNDILFVDSTHVSKTGSDVNYLLFEILPSLRKGVLIHFHDIMYPFEYLKRWVFEGRSWNEIYTLRSFLMYNSSFQIVLFPHYLHTNHPKSFANMPTCQKDIGGSLWLRKVK